MGMLYEYNEQDQKLLFNPINGHLISMPPKIKWQHLPGLKLQAYTDDVAPRGFERGLNESDMDPIQSWSDKTKCGRRISFNIWQFKSKKYITMFLLRWS
jgi:hypothetical protein